MRIPFAFATATLLLAACARQAPELPPDMSSKPADQRLLPGDLSAAEGAMTCTQLAATSKTVDMEAKALEQVIASNRGSNQALGYFSAVVLPPLALAMTTNDDEKARLDQLQLQRDRINRLAAAKSCPR